jgi:ribosomal protein S17
MMADRGMTAAVLTEVAESQNKPFHLVEIYFTSGTVYFTDSDLDITWNSNTYSAAGYFLTFSEINEQNALTVSEIEVQLSGVDQTYITEILSETFMDRNLIIRKGFLNDSNAVIVDPIIIYSGKMDQPNIIETSEGCTIAVTVANLFVDFTKTKGRYTNDESQQLFFSNDDGFQYAYQIIKEINWGKEGFGGGGLPPAPPVIPPGFPGSTYIIPTFTIPTYPYYIPSTVLGGGFSVTSSVSTLTVNAYNHGYTTGDKITIANALAVGEVPATSINKEHTVTTVNSNKFTVPISETITTSVTNGGGAEYTINEAETTVPFITTNTTTNTENIVKITAPKNEVKQGDMVEIKDSNAVGGIPADNMNGKHYVKSVEEDSFDIEVKKFEKTTAPPIKTTSGSTTVKVKIANNKKNIGDTVVIAGSADTGGVAASNINGTQTITAVTENTVSFTSAGTATSTTTGGGNSVTVDAKKPVTPPFETTSGSTTVTFNQGSHGLAVGDKFTVFNAMPVAGYDPSEINKEHTVVSVPNSDSVTFTTTSTANATTSGGGSSSVVFLPVKATSAETGGGASSTIGMPTSVV